MRKLIFKSLEIDAEKMEIYYNGIKIELGYTKAERLLEASYVGKIPVTKLKVSKETPLYASCRKFLMRESSQGRIYMDILLYNKALGLFEDKMYNRSLGHVNDTDEIEIHQVLNGKVIVFMGKENFYWGLFRKGDFFEIPSGYFHCTYVIEDETVVANLYANIFWEEDIDRKPYFTIRNPYSIHESEREKEYLLYKNGKIDTVIKDRENFKGLLDYKEIPKDLFRISNKYEIGKSIIDLLYEI